MIRVLRVYLWLGLIMAASQALSAPMLLNHQGRVTDGSGAPVSGVVPIKFSLFDSSSDGTLVWSETQPTVTVTDGLYSVALGSVTPLSADIFASPPSSGTSTTELYLEIEVNGQVLSPRMRLVSSPYSIATERISGDLYTSPGQLLLSDGSGHTVDLHLQPLGGDILIHNDADLLASMTGSDTGSAVSVRTNSPGHKSVGEITLRTSPSSTGLNGVRDFDEDGIPDLVVTSLVTDDSSAVVVESYDQNGGSLIRGKSKGILLTNVPGSGVGTPSYVQSRLTHDADDDGNPETSAQTVVTADSVVDARDLDSDDDGAADAISRETIKSPASGELEIIIQRVMSQPGHSTGVITQVNDTASRILSYGDLDGDGAPDLGIEQTSGVSSAKLKMFVDKNADGTIGREELSELSGEGVIHTLTLDEDHDGNPERKMTYGGHSQGGTTGPLMVSRLQSDDDDDGSPDVSSETGVMPGRAYVAIKTKGTGADANRTTGAATDADSTTSTSTNYIDLDGDSVPDIAIADVCTIDSVYKETTYGYPNAVAPVTLMKVKEKANKTKCGNNLRQLNPASATETDISCDSMGASATWSADNFSGAPSSVTIQASIDGSLNPIEHSSGAHLTPGGVWTNASDKSLKENFQAVDGEAILEKIDELPITQWNYKVEGSDVSHIGPTAQDFQAVFGLGGDDKSISTIDPAGIALAAIKALNEKSKRVDELEAKVTELTRLVEKLAKDQK